MLVLKLSGIQISMEFIYDIAVMKNVTMYPNLKWPVNYFEQTQMDFMWYVWML